MDAVEVKEEVVQLSVSVGPYHEGIVHVSEPAEEFVGDPSELPIETEKTDVRTWKKNLKLSLSKCQIKRFRASLSGTLVKSEMTLKLTKMSMGLTWRVFGVLLMIL
jgi:hypothetical protein